MANTQQDKNWQDYYQKNIRSKDTDEASRVFKAFGSNVPLIIGFIGATSVGIVLQNTKYGDYIFDGAISTLRGVIVGLPPLWFGQVLLGADRPSQNTNSRWHPFKNDHGVSGHAFMGAVPFITAAKMTDSTLLKIAFYAGSTLCGLSRINDNAHYPSQVIFGWVLAYASAVAVNKTNVSLSVTGDMVSLGYEF